MAPVAQTGAGNVTTASSASAVGLTASKPANISDGDLLWAVLYHRNSNGTITAPSGWSIAKTDGSNGTWCFATKPVPSAAGETATSYTFNNNQGSARCVLMVGRITGADLSAPIDAVGPSAAITGTASVVLPSMTAATAGALLLAIPINNAGANIAVFTAPAGMTEVAQQGIVSGAATANAMVAQQLLASAGATGTRTATVSPAASNSGGFMVTIRAGITDKTVAVGQAAETDTADSAATMRLVAFAQASEGDAANLIASGEVIPIGQAVETNSAAPMVGPFARATETDTATAFTRVKARAAGQAVETGAATPMTITKKVTIGQAVENDTGQAAGPRVALAPETLLFGQPVPLGVRIYNNRQAAFDVWVTNAVDDFTFRSAVPGGFASATIRLHRPSIVASPGSGYLYNADKAAFDNLARLFNRVQIVDLRSAEIVWEGRIEDPRRSSDSDTWEIGCLGSSVVASDIQRPMFYIDSDINSWVQKPENFWQFSTNEDKQVIEVRWEGNLVWPGPAGGGGGVAVLYEALRWGRAQECGLWIGRYDITFASSAPAGTGNQAPARLWNSVIIEATDGSDGLDQELDATNYTQNVRHMRRLGAPLNQFGTTGGFTAEEGFAVAIEMGVGNNSGFGDYTSAPDKVVGRIAQPRVQVQRLNRNGTRLLAPSDYPGDYVTVPQVVEDVVGRFLVGGWAAMADWTSTSGRPFSGHVRPTEAYIDASSPARFTHLTYFDGATASQILADMMDAQLAAYWALWESRYGATNGAGGQNERGFRFEWATWPNGWGYQASSLDGLEEQPNGEDLYNFLFYKWTQDDTWNLTAGDKRLWTAEDGRSFEGEFPELAYNQLSRAITATREEPTILDVVTSEAPQILRRYSKVKNAGTITIRRPIYFYDVGANSWSGAARMVQPWEIRPGKLIRITDLPPRGMIQDFSHGTAAPPREHDGTVFRIVATEYNSADNSCRLELDQVQTWSIPTQITKNAPAASGAVVKG
ncbi:MAG: hypothetical protein IRZ07_03415 [Microbispora sp.]|nr:hypothetical protein [Microbispora sp.]